MRACHSICSDTSAVGPDDVPVRLGVSFAATVDSTRGLKEASVGCTEYYLLAIQKGSGGAMRSIDVVLHQQATVADVVHSYFHARLLKSVWLN